jgi:hypothetical protein
MRLWTICPPDCENDHTNSNLMDLAILSAQSVGLTLLLPAFLGFPMFDSEVSS